jgi:alkylation response protein AidB-like acyl-CoA dehydrogenase
MKDRVQAVAGIVSECADVGDTQGQLAAPVIDAFHREGLFGMWVPRSLRGGLELAPLASMDVLEEVTYGDPSAGWVLMATCLATGTGGAYLGAEAVAELFGKERLPVIAGQGTRPGTAVSVPGGFRLTGSWSFGSGLKHATHIHTLGVVPATGQARIFVLPVESATLLGNWDVMGLRATGSIDYRIDDVFVPEAFTHVATIDQPLRGGALYSLGVIGIALLCHAAWAAGIGRRILDELGAKVQTGVGRTGTLAASEAFHEQYARAEGKYRAAKAFVREVWTDVSASLEAGTPVTVRQHTMIRLALANITWTCHEVSQFAYTASGTLALRAGTMQRLFRDMHAGTQHITSAPPVIRNAGRELAGLAPGKKWLFFDLVDQP